MKISSIIYKMARGLGKVATTINDIETVASMNPNKIRKRAGRKTVYKAVNTIGQKINRTIFK